MNLNFDWVWKMRTAVFIIAILIVAVTSCVSCSRKKDDEEKEVSMKKHLANPRLAFWPPDVIPHPHLPNPEPSPTDPNADPDNPKNWADIS